MITSAAAQQLNLALNRPHLGPVRQLLSDAFGGRELAGDRRSRLRTDRRVAPLLDEIVRLRLLGDPVEDIADTYECHRRAVYGAVDRAAWRGQLPPIMIPVLFPDDFSAQERLASIVGGAHRTGVDVWGWEHVARANSLVSADRGQRSERS